jgi:hypothetical protein
MLLDSGVRQLRLIKYSVVIVCVVLSLGAWSLMKPSNTVWAGKEVKPITTFSLGSARFQPFRQRPSAKQLYDTALKLHDSFKTAAASKKVSMTGYLLDLGRKEPMKSDPEYDLRSADMDKELSVSKMNGKPAIVLVHNDGKVLFYNVSGKTYSIGQMEPSERGDHSWAASWAELTLVPGEQITGYQLLADSRVGGTDTYVLELTTRLNRRSPVMGRGQGKRKIWLGKSDLLPRRIESSTHHQSGGITQQNDCITEFRGFAANPGLSSAMFSLSPPEGARSSEPTHR